MSEREIQRFIEYVTIIEQQRQQERHDDAVAMAARS